MTIPGDPDILVVGAGSAGAATAGMLAAAGWRVALVDARPLRDAGARWENGVPAWMFDAAGLERPEAPGRSSAPGRSTPQPPHRAVICDAAGDVAIPLPADPLLHVDMRRLVARLQDQARGAGAVLTQERVVDVTLAAGRPRRVVLTAGGHTREVSPRLLVDASGMAAAVRRQIPGLQGSCAVASPRDVCQAAQHQHRVTRPAEAIRFLARHGAAPGDSLSFLGVAGGFSVLMVRVSDDLQEVGVLSGSVPAAGVPAGAALVDRLVQTEPWIGERLWGGAGPIPLAPPCARLSGPGVAILGDAANMVHGMHGSGVGMGLVAARILADHLAGAADPGDPARLHQYGAEFLRRYGGRLAAADVFRRFSQRLSRADLTALMRSGLVNPRTLAAGLDQAPLGPATVDLASLARGLRHAPRILATLAPVALRMVALEAVYRDYPGSRDEPRLARFRRVARWLERR